MRVDWVGKSVAFDPLVRSKSLALLAESLGLRVTSFGGQCICLRERFRKLNLIRQDLSLKRNWSPHLILI